ncbi:MAG: zinc-dependent metalloprotease [Sumerlaeia bacterium]
MSLKSRPLALPGAAAFVLASALALPAWASNEETAAIPDNLKAAIGAITSSGGSDKGNDFENAVKDLEKREGFINLYISEEKNQLLAEIPGNLIGKDLLLSSSISRGPNQGFQWGSLMIRFEKLEDELIVVAPDPFYTASGTLKDVVERTYPDPVATTVRVRAEKGKNVLIDLMDLFGNKASALAGTRPAATIMQPGKAKAFPNNVVVEIVFRNSRGATGITYSLDQLPNTGYKPRQADQRIGYFLTAQKDFSKDEEQPDIFDRYINRWHLEKADPSLKLSPPKEPIVFYLEDSIPVRYRRWVRQGVEDWNKAFEKIGIVDAIVVRQQTSSNEFKDLDPEDARYNFIRWITSESAFAMGPSRVDPRTGQIYDADIIFDESMVRYYVDSHELFIESVPNSASLSPRLRHWLASNPSAHPNWSMVRPDLALRIQNDAEMAAAGVTPEELFARELIGNLDGFKNPHYCSLGEHVRGELALARMAAMGRDFIVFEQMKDAAKKEKEAEEKAEAAAEDDASSKTVEVAEELIEELEEAAEAAEEEDGEETADAEENGSNGKKPEKRNLDEWPEEFIGPLVREIMAHEVGHTLGLRHNFKASTWKSYEEIVNTDDPTTATIASVMDYNPYALKPDGSQPAMWITPTIGPYDYWAIEYGYAIPGSNDYPRNEDKLLKQITDKVAQPGHDYGTDEDTWGPDPMTVRFDLGSDPLTFAAARVDLADKILNNLIEAVLQEDDPYSKARDAFDVLFYQRFSAAYAAARFVGGYHIRRDQRGDTDARQPIEVVDAETQRRAFNMLLEKVFAKDAIQVKPELQVYLAADRWSHRGSSGWYQPLTYPIQDRILMTQNNILFMLTNPERVQWIYDSEFTSEAEDLFTLPEMMSGLTDSIWSEVLQAEGEGSQEKYTTRKPFVDNLRRNLQRSYLGQLIKIATGGDDSMYPAVSRTLSHGELAKIGDAIGGVMESPLASQLDPYTAAHLRESKARVDAALDAQITVGGNRGGGSIILMLGQEGNSDPSAGATFTGDAPMPRMRR